MRIAAKLILWTLAAAALASWSATSSQNWDEAYGAAKTTTVRKTAPRGIQTPTAKDLARIPFTAEEQALAAIPGIPDARVWGDSETDFRRVLPQKSGPWLTLSGGGADGVFGAGVINGWTQSGNRPEFAVVTGASIGALIAPYTFLGPRYDKDIREIFTSLTAADVFDDRMTGESLSDTWPLRQLIEKRLTADLLAEIAAEHEKGRRLFVITTNMDAARRMVWNMGAIAARGGDKSLKLFRDVLLASSSIPVYFPPVFIEVEANGKTFQEMHLDGTISAPFFVAPESAFKASGAGLPTKQIYVIINRKLSPSFEMPRRNTTSILGRMIGVALTTGLRAELLAIGAGAQRIGVAVDVAMVPESFTQENEGLFDQKYMRSLYEFGAKQSKNGSAFENVLSSAIGTQTDTPH